MRKILTALAILTIAAATTHAGTKGKSSKYRNPRLINIESILTGKSSSRPASKTSKSSSKSTYKPKTYTKIHIRNDGYVETYKATQSSSGKITYKYQPSKSYQSYRYRYQNFYNNYPIRYYFRR